MSEIVVVLKDKSFCEEFESLIIEQNLTAQRIHGLPRFFIFADIRPDEFPLVNYHGIRSIEDGEHELHPEETVNDVDDNVQLHNLRYGGWAPTRIINRKSPWESPKSEVPFKCRRTGKGVDVYMIDSGCYVDHPEFDGRAQQPFVLKETFDPRDDTGHGTACLSVVGGKTLGIAKQAQLFSYKFNSEKRRVSASGFIITLGVIKEHYEQRKLNGRPGVAFCSWGGFNETINSAITDCIDVGLVCCFPAGNSLADLDIIDHYPAEGDPDAIICAGLNIRDRPYYTFDGHGTSFGSPVDILAPGQDVVVARRIEDDGNYRFGDGTSYSTPYVVGVLACMLEGYEPLSTRNEVRSLKNRLIANATQGELKRGYAPGSIHPDSKDPDKDFHRLPDRILYLDPHLSFEPIPGLTPKVV